MPEALSEASAAPTAPKPATTIKVTLQEPIARAGGDVAEIELRKPKAGELRNLKLGELINSDVGAMITLLPRISTPFITEQEAGALASEDIAEIAGAIVGFFLTPAQKAMIQKLSGG